MIFNFIKNILKIHKYINHNKKKFNQNKIITKNFILVDQFNYYPSLIPLSHFIDRLRKKFDSNVYIYQTFVEKNFFQDIKNFFQDVNKFGYLNIYKSFGCINKFYNKYDSSIVLEASNKLEEIYPKISSKDDILKIEIENIYIGDLLYDTFLITKKKPTIDINNKEFKIFFFDFLKLFYFWKNYFETNSDNIKASIISHDTYHHALPLRFSIKFKIPCYHVAQGKIYFFSKEKIRKKTAYEEFPQIFENINSEIKRKGLIESEQTIKDKFTGKITVDMQQLQQQKMINTYQDKAKISKEISLLKDKNNILIATHCFTDAVHAYGESIFPDFYEWLMFLGYKSEKTKYKWLLKPHPAQAERNHNFLKFFENKFKNFILIPNEVSSLHLIDKIFSVLTVYGSVGHEYPLFNIPVINASANNPHIAYKFNFHAKNLEEYSNLIDKIDLLKINSIDHKSKIYEYYYLNYLRDYYFFNNHLEILNKLGAKYSKPDILEEWINEYSSEKKIDIDQNLDRFINEKTHRLYALDK